jgi:hypothetical protein
MKKFLLLVITLITISVFSYSQNSTQYIITYNDDNSISFTEIKFSAEEVEKLKEVFIKVDELVQEETRSIKEAKITFDDIPRFKITLYRFGVNSFLKIENEVDTAYLYIEEGEKYINYLEKYRTEHLK